MRWDDTYQATNEMYRWYDLLEGEGTEDDALLGYVREKIGHGEFITQINHPTQQTAKFTDLEEAKAHILTYYVTQKLEGE